MMLLNENYPKEGHENVRCLSLEQGVKQALKVCTRCFVFKIADKEFINPCKD